jgi:hypothetical protein
LEEKVLTLFLNKRLQKVDNLFSEQEHQNKIWYYH